MATEEAPNEWNSDDALDALKMERATNPELDDVGLAMKMLAEAAPQAAASIIHIAMNEMNANTRLRAATYIMDRAYDPNDTDGRATWETLLEEMAEEAEKLANSRSKE